MIKSQMPNFYSQNSKICYAKECPKISVVTPTYNMGHFLSACLRSVMNQTYSDIEHIVVDGASSDNTIELLENWAIEGQNRLFLSQKDKGMYEAVNRGGKLSRGKYMAYLNADDLYFPWAIETLIANIENSGADIVYGDLLRVYWDGKISLKLQPPHDSRYFGFFFQLAQPTAMWKKSVFDEVGGFNPYFKYGGDTDFFLRCSKKNYKFHKVDEVICIEQHRKESLSVAMHKALLKEMEISAVAQGGTSGIWSRAVRNPHVILRGLLRQIQTALAFSRSFGEKNPKRWTNFLSGNYLKDLSTTKLLFNQIPKPIFSKKFSVGKADIEGILEATWTSKY